MITSKRIKQIVRNWLVDSEKQNVVVETFFDQSKNIFKKKNIHSESNVCALCVMERK
jgi:hypothetical protein